MSKMTDSIEEWLLSFECGKTWLKTMTSEETKGLYIKTFKIYCDATGKTPTELLLLKPTLFEMVMLLQNGKATADTEVAAENLLNDYLYTNTDVSAHVRLSLLTAVKSFYKENNRELKSTVGERLTLPESKKRKPSMQDLAQMDDALVHHRDRALLWFIESAPFRAGTVKKLFWGDLKSTEELLRTVRQESCSVFTEQDAKIAQQVPYYIEVFSDRMKGAGVGKYVGAKQIGFLHSFAAKKLEKYKLEMQRLDMCITPETPLFVGYGTNASAGKGEVLRNLGYIFANACEAAFPNQNKIFSPQDMREFLQSALEKVEVNPNLISPMLGHKVKGVDKHYSSHDIAEFLEVFVKALPLLVPQTVEQVKYETQNQIAEDKKRITTIESENASLKSNYSKLESEVKEVWAMLERLSGNQRKTMEAKMRNNDEEAQEQERQERAEILSKNQAEDEKTYKENLKKLQEEKKHLVPP